MQIPRRSCVTLLLLAMMLTACASQRSKTPAAPTAFTIDAPAGWEAARAAPGGALWHTRIKIDDQHFPSLVSLGIAPVEGAADRSGALSEETARKLLQARLNNPQQVVLTLDLSQREIDGVRCVAYTATQADRYDPESTEARRDYRHRGAICPHPRDGRLYQIFVSLVYVRSDGAPPDRAQQARADVAVDSLRWTR